MALLPKRSHGVCACVLVCLDVTCALCVVAKLSMPLSALPTCASGKSMQTNMYETEHCRLSGLPDLNHSMPYVQNTLTDWVAGLVANFSVDGIRIDTVPEVRFCGHFFSSIPDIS